MTITIGTLKIDNLKYGDLKIKNIELHDVTCNNINELFNLFTPSSAKDDIISDAVELITDEMIEEINNDMEHVEKQNITNELIQDTLKNCDKSVNTKKSYTSSIKKMLQQYNECDYNDLFYNKNKNFVKIIENMSKNPSTQNHIIVH